MFTLQTLLVCVFTAPFQKNIRKEFLSCIFFSNFKSHLKESQGLLESSTDKIHHGRALLEYTDKYNIDIEKFSSAKEDNVNTKNRRENKKSMMKKGLQIERDNGKTGSLLKKNSSVKAKRNSLTNMRNVTQQIPSLCKPTVNETEMTRLVE